MDAFLVNGYNVQPAYVLVNNSAGRFGWSVPALYRWPGDTVALGDINGDGFAPAFQPNRL